MESKPKKDKIAAGLLAILLGSLGAHLFYLGNNTLGIIYLCTFWTGIPGVLGVVQGILYLIKTDEEFQKIYVEEQRFL